MGGERYVCSAAVRTYSGNSVLHLLLPGTAIIVS